MSPILFAVFAAVALSGALGVVLARNPVHSALFLVMTMITMAAFFLGLNAPMVAIVQIVVYASAIVVLFLFVIMLLGIDKHEDVASDPRIFHRAAAGLLGALTLGALLLMPVLNWQTGQQTASGRPIAEKLPTRIEALHTKTQAAVDATKGDSIRPLARTLFTTYAWPFQVTAVLLVIAVVGAVVLARRSQRSSNSAVAS